MNSMTTIRHGASFLAVKEVDGNITLVVALFWEHHRPLDDASCGRRYIS